MRIRTDSISMIAFPEEMVMKLKLRGQGGLSHGSLVLAGRTDVTEGEVAVAVERVEKG